MLCRFDDCEKQLAWRVLSTILTGSNDAPLKKAIIGGNLGQDVELEVMDELLQPYLLLVIRNTDREKLEDIRACVRGTIQQLVSDGLRKKELKAILNQMEFFYRERKEPAGVLMATNSYKAWNYDGDPAQFLSIGGLYEQLRQKADTGYFEELLKEGLLDEETLSTIVAVPDPTLAEKRQEEEQQRLIQAKEAWGDSIREYIERNRVLDEWQAAEDTPEQKATLPQLKRSDLERDPKHFEPEVRELRSVPVLLYPKNENGVVYLNLYFNIAGVTREHLPEVALLADLLTRLRTEDHTLSELQEEIRGNIGVLRFFPDAYTVSREKESCYPVLGVMCSVLSQNVAKAVELILEIMQKTVFEKETILPLLQQSKEQFRQVFINGGHGASVLRIGAHSSAESLAKECFNGYTAASYIKELADNYEERFEEIIANCRMYSQELFTSSRLTISISGEEYLPEAEKLIQALPVSQAQRCKVHYPLLESGSEGIQVPAQNSFAAVGNNLQRYDGAYNGALRVASQILTYGYLWNEIRVKGGAYGTGFASSPSGNIACWSYRDPSPINSLKIYQGAADYLKELAEEQSDLTSYIIGTIASGEPLTAPATRIMMSDGRWFSGITYEVRQELRHQILETEPEDLKAIADVMKKCLEEGTVCVVGSKETLEAAGIETIHTI